jgi:plastocyanin
MIAAVQHLEPVASAAGSAAVRAQDFDFKPGTARIAKGGRVTWRFLDGQYVPHNVHSAGRRRFKPSDDLTSGTYSVSFRRRGTYRYVCTLHANMKGKVVVS